MTDQQFEQILEFGKPYYKKTGRWHAWDHITGVMSLVEDICLTEHTGANKKCALAAAALHDMGRTVRDEGHAAESGKIAKPFLHKIGIDEKEIMIINDAIVHHDIELIDKAKTVEARIVFDADKIEILSVYGFMRVAFWLVEERKMELGEAVAFLWGYCERFRKKLYTNYAKEKVKDDLVLLEQLIKKFSNYENQRTAKTF